MVKKDNKLTTKELAFCDLVLAGWDATKAYRLLHPNSTAKGDSMKVQASRLKTSPKVAEYLIEKELELTFNTIGVNSSSDESLPSSTQSIEDVELDDDYLTRHNQIRRYKAIMDGTKDERIKIACLEAINKLMGYHKDSPTQKEQVVFYLPLTCHLCKYYKEKQEQRKQERLKQLKQNEEISLNKIEDGQCI
ncbi:MAG: hypothetical protein ACK5KT_10545 [Dysgonomonas sp.]